MMLPIVTENSAGIPLHSYISSLPQTGGGGVVVDAPYLKMISENLVVPVGLAVITHHPSHILDDNVDLTDKELKEIPDELFDQCLGLVSSERTKQTSRRKLVGKKRASKRSWF
jgi:hypothetical protein